MEVVMRYSDTAPDVIRFMSETDGVRKTKTLPLDSMIPILEKALKDDDVPMIQVGALPRGYIDGSISADRKKLECLMSFTFTEKFPFLCKGEVFEIPMPNLIFKFLVVDGRLSKHFCGILGKDGALYHYPFGNVYDDGHICWGSIQTPTVRSFKDMEKLVEAFLGGETSAHLQHVVKVGNQPMDQMQLLHYLSGKKTWPSNIKLVPWSVTLEQLETVWPGVR